jgi:hypothetical protein
MNPDLSALHARLLAEVDQPREIWAPPPAAEPLGRQRLALRAVIARHAPVPCPPPCSVRHVHVTCAAGCRAADPYGPHYPCTEIRHIEHDLTKEL